MLFYYPICYKIGTLAFRTELGIKNQNGKILNYLNFSLFVITGQ
jgi:hypothetical protein